MKLTITNTKTGTRETVTLTSRAALLATIGETFDEGIERALLTLEDDLLAAGLAFVDVAPYLVDAHLRALATKRIALADAARAATQ